MSNARGKSQAGKPTVCAIAVAVIAAVVSGTACAQEPIVFPAKGQSNKQMESDKYGCYSWAKSQTGFDPMQAPTASAQAQPKSKSSAVRGAAGGAATGAAVGAIAGNAGTGAAIGAAAGGIIGGARKRRGEQEQEAYAQQQATAASNQRSEYNRAWSACLEGKGYTVK